jgi:uncharacterized protein (DUF1778 family)
MSRLRTGERARAHDHYEHREDDTRWGDPVEVQAPEQLVVMVSARFSRDEADRVGKAAADAGMTRSAFIRQAALTAVRGKSVDIEKIRRELTEIMHDLSNVVAEDLPS